MRVRDVGLRSRMRREEKRGRPQGYPRREGPANTQRRHRGTALARGRGRPAAGARSGSYPSCTIFILHDFRGLILIVAAR